MNMPYVQRKCVSCGQLFVICSKCFRGQKTCSVECRLRRSRKQSRIRSSRYVRTKQGRSNNRSRQSKHRRSKLLKKHGVTHATSEEHFKSISNSKGRSTKLTCAFCGLEVHICLQDCPHPATAWRRMISQRKRRKNDLKGARGQDSHAGKRWT